MLRVSVVDANMQTAKEYAGIVASVVGQWIEWELGRLGIGVHADPATADLIFLVHAGAVDWLKACRRELRTRGVDPDARARGRRPYVIAGGPVDAVPLNALAVGDAVFVGEAYTAVREVAAMVAAGRDVAAISDWVEAYPHAIERRQVERFRPDPERPWLLGNPPDEPLASPDPYVDWSVPPVKSDDKVVRVLGSKGCHFKCSFCATTYRQSYRKDEDSRRVLDRVRKLSRAGERVQVISNDPANLDYYPRILEKMASGSYTVEEFLSPPNRRAIYRQKPGVVRFGLEGLSQRLRFAWNKPVPDPMVVEIIGGLAARKVTSHLFMIWCSPFEEAEDWAAFRELYKALARVLDKGGLCRMKMTTFQPSPPAPLMRFTPNASSWRHWQEFDDWKHSSYPCTHLYLVPGRHPEKSAADVAEALQVDVRTSRALLSVGVTTDLAPTPDDFHRMPSNALVKWPISSAARWRVAEKYRERMRPGVVLPAIATTRRVVGIHRASERAAEAG